MGHVDSNQALKTRKFGSRIDDNVSQLEKSVANLSINSFSQTQNTPLPPKAVPFSLISKQQTAIDIVNDSLCVFSMEISDSGARRYFNAHPRQLWSKFISKTNSKSLPRSHFYEVILPRRSCRLYMDLDLKRPNLQFEYSDVQIATAVHSVVFHSLASNYQSGRFRFAVDETVSINNLRLVVQSASVKSEKISLHFIWPDVIFESNIVCGEYVKSIQDKLFEYFDNKKSSSSACKCSLENLDIKCRDQAFSSGAHSLIFRNTDNSSLVNLIDKGVYDRNRNWRLWRSAKRAGGLPLKLLKLFGFAKSSVTITEEQIFLNSLVCPSPELLEECNLDHGQIRLYRQRDQNYVGCSQLTKSGSCTFGCDESPFPAVDEFLCNEILSQFTSKSTDTNRLIRSWRYYSSSSSIIYDISNQLRFCTRINRPHRSNRIFFSVSLSTGEIYQRCYDPDCRNYRSFPPWLLPKALLLSSN